MTNRTTSDSMLASGRLAEDKLLPLGAANGVPKTEAAHSPGDRP